MKKSLCCNEDMIYFGKNYHPNVMVLFKKPNYIYCCYKCGKLEWSFQKEKCKYKWYKFSKEELKSIVERGGVELYDGNITAKS